MEVHFDLHGINLETASTWWNWNAGVWLIHDQIYAVTALKHVNWNPLGMLGFKKPLTSIRCHEPERQGL